MRSILKWTALGFLIVAASLSLAWWMPADTTSVEKEQALAKVILAELNENHYSPKTVDDNFSKEVFTAFLSAIDYEKQFLTEETLDQLKGFETQIDEDLQQGSFTFFDAALRLLEEGIKEAQQNYKAAINGPIDLEGNAIWETDHKKRTYAKNSKELKDRWRQIVAYEMIQNLWALELEGEGTNDRKAMEKKALQATKKTLDRFFEEVAEQTRTDRLSKFFNAMLSVYGPHNSYLTPKAREDFSIEASHSLQGVGVSLERDGPYIKVDEVIAGGPAWKSKQIEIGDIMLKLTEADGTTVEVTGKTVDEAVTYFRGEKGTVVTLTVQKINGEIMQVPITRDVIILEAGLARSLVLENDKAEGKVGYIQLPRFYYTRGDQGRSCADDVRAEIEKLQKIGVDGLVIDLRNNRGGSLAQTLRMAGFFIEAGPVLQWESRDGSLKSHGDRDSSVLYSGELIVLVNGASGSASELFSGTLQDYDRAVIVGSKSTYGKGTIQKMLDLDRPDLVDSTLFPLGTLKMTIGKFYRITGASTQLKGVEPDIVLPEINSLVVTGERALQNPLAWTEIAPIPFQQSVNTNANLEAVSQSSAERVRQSADFVAVKEQAKQIKNQRENSAVSLNYKVFSATKKKVSEEQEQPVGSKDIAEMLVHNLTEDTAYIQSDPARTARNQEWLEAVKKDIYINECLLIMHDLSNQ
ncbi:MAG: tail-specific protease [Saprospiraceae bacterium]|nr:MAG: tail-specific protease [Saprospiraceae bacterium]